VGKCKLSFSCYPFDWHDCFSTGLIFSGLCKWPWQPSSAVDFVPFQLSVLSHSSSDYFFLTFFL
jgi:hypothetical protein